MNTTEIRSQLELVRKDINAALAEVAKKHGLQALALGRGTFSENSFTLKVEGVFAGGASKDAQRYDSLRHYHPELPARDSADRFLTNGSKTIELVGANTTGTKIIARQDGKEYLYKVDAILGMIRRAQAAKGGK